MVARTPYETHDAYVGGVVAGAVAGAVLSIVLAIANIAQGRGIWPTFKFAAYPFFHDRALTPSFDAAVVATGFVTHFVISALWGLLFALLAFELSRGWTVVAGALFGVVVWLGMFYVVMPLGGMGGMAKSAPVAMAVINHVLFGVVTSLAFLPFQRHVPRSSPIAHHAAAH